MKVSGNLATALLGIGICAAVCVAFVPRIVRHLGPGHTVKGPGDAYGEAFAVLFLWALLVLVSVVASLLASLLAWFAARHAGLGPGMKWGCWLPVPLAVAASAWLWSKLPG